MGRNDHGNQLSRRAFMGAADHNWFPQHDSWASGKNNRWVITHSEHNVDGPAQGPLVMGYYDRENLPLHGVRPISRRCRCSDPRPR